MPPNLSAILNSPEFQQYMANHQMAPATIFRLLGSTPMTSALGEGAAQVTEGQFDPLKLLMSAAVPFAASHALGMAVPFAASRFPGIMRLFHETSPAEAAALATSHISKEGLNVSPVADYALGQGTNKGALVTFKDMENIGVQPLTHKPGLELANRVEGLPTELRIVHAPTEPGQVESILLQPDQAFSRATDRRLINMGWTSELHPGGGMLWTAPAAKP